MPNAEAAATLTPPPPPPSFPRQGPATCTSSSPAPGCKPVADAAAQVAGIAKVLLADDAAYDHALAENVAPLLVKLAPGYSHLLAPATTAGKN